MANCVRNIYTKNYPILVIGFQVTVKNVGDVFETQCKLHCVPKKISDIIDCNLKINYQILIIIGTNISDRTCH